MLEAYWELVKNQGRFWHDGYFRLTEQGSAPGTPPANELHLYAKDKAGTSAIYVKNDAGTEYELAAQVPPSIGGTITSGTTGSVLFVGAGPVFAQDNSNFFWDNSAKRLGIGTASPAGPLHVLRAALTDGAVRVTSAGSHGLSFLLSNSVSATRLAIAGGSAEFTPDAAAGDTILRAGDSNKLFLGDSAKARMVLDSSGYSGFGTTTPTQRLSLYGTTQEETTISQRRASADTGAPGIFIQKARGSVSVPAATQSSDILGTIGLGGYDGSAWQLNAAIMQGIAGSLWSGTNRESYLLFATVPSASTTRTERLRITTDIEHASGTRHRMLSQNRFRYLQSIARATKITSNQTLTHDTLTAISFNSETFDTDTLHDNSTNNTRLTAPLTGKYLVLGNAEFSDGADTTQRLIGIRANAGTIYGQQRFVSENGDVSIVSTAAIVSLSASGYVELVARHKHGSNLDVVASENTSIAMYYIGE